MRVVEVFVVLTVVHTYVKMDKSSHFKHLLSNVYYLSTTPLKNTLKRMWVFLCVLVEQFPGYIKWKQNMKRGTYNVPPFKKLKDMIYTYIYMYIFF